MKQILLLTCVCLLGFSSASLAEDYKIRKQQQSCYSALFYRLGGDNAMYTINRNECNRYGMLMIQDRIDNNANQDWLLQNVWLVKKGAWQSRRQSMGAFIPTDSSSIYLAILLETEGIDLLRGHGLLNVPLFYQTEANKQTALPGGSYVTR